MEAREMDVRACAVAVAGTLLLWTPAASAGQVLAEDADVDCAYHEYVLCVTVIVRGQLGCALAGVDATCSGIQEWIRNAGSIAGLPGEVEGRFSWLLSWCVDDACSAESGDLAFPACPWEPLSLGCGGRELGPLTTGPVALAAGECLEATLVVDVTGHAVAPGAAPLDVFQVDAAASASMVDRVCA